MFSSAFDNLVRKAEQNVSEQDFVGDDGLLHCHKCGGAKQYELPLPEVLGGGTRKVVIPCECRKREIEAEEEAERQHKFEVKITRMREDGLTHPKFLQTTFAIDDRRDVKTSDACRKYVENWPQMRADNIGLLFYGDVGVGKSFYACCIANALLAKRVTACVTSFPTILNKLQNFQGDRQEFLNNLRRYDLLMIDDLGVERSTEYSVEQLFNVIDARAQDKKPLIVTTNLTPKQLTDPENLAYKRVYDRVLGMCPVRIKMTGESRRAEDANAKKDAARALLGL